MHYQKVGSSYELPAFSKKVFGLIVIADCNALLKGIHGQNSFTSPITGLRTASTHWLHQRSALGARQPGQTTHGTGSLSLAKRVESA